MIDTASVLLFAAAVCCGQPAPAPELSVKGAGSRGTLIFAADAVEFRVGSADKSRRWSYAELREIRINGPKRLSLDIYETRSRWRFGRAKAITFDVVGEPIGGDLVAAVLARAPRAVRTNILPSGLPDATIVVPASHRRFGSATQGTLEFGPSGLLYRSTAPGDSRFWRFPDLQSVARTSPFDVLVTAYEGGDLAPYAFELKTPWPSASFDALWQQVNPPRPRSEGGR
jgi:hypothetical protein